MVVEEEEEENFFSPIIKLIKQILIQLVLHILKQIANLCGKRQLINRLN